MHSIVTTSLAAIAVALAALVGCGATEPVEPLASDLSFALDGERWTATTPVTATVSAYGYQLFAELRFEDRFPLRQSIHFSVSHGEWDGVGDYPLALRSADDDVYVSFVGEADGDATIANYYADADAPGELRVTRYDPETGEVEGTFFGTFVVTDLYEGQPLRELPDTLRVTDGRFRATFEDRR